MTQKEFEELSENEVRFLNGYESLDYVTEAWRAGYTYAQSIIRKSFQEDYHEEFLSRVEKFIEDDLEEFAFKDYEREQLRHTRCRGQETRLSKKMASKRQI